jgi:LysW-gamma-L-lysine carboxypeptidase
VLDELEPNYVVVGEPSGWNGVTLGYRGSVRLSYSLTVPKTHHGEGSPLPAEEAVSFFRNLEENLELDNSGFNSTDVRLTDIETTNGPFEDEVNMVLDVRTSPGFNPGTLTEFIENNSGEATVEKTRYIPPVKSSKRSKLVSALIGGIREAGGQPKFKLKTGTADMNILAENWDVPIVAYGPGDSSLDHTPNEHLDLEEYALAQEVLREALAKLGGSKRGRS